MGREPRFEQRHSRRVLNASRNLWQMEDLAPRLEAIKAKFEHVKEYL